MYKELDGIITKLHKAGVNIQLLINYPWVYIDKINNRKVIEKYNSEHGWVVGIYNKNKFKIDNIKEFFNLIRKYK